MADQASRHARFQTQRRAPLRLVFAAMLLFGAMRLAAEEESESSSDPDSPAESLAEAEREDAQREEAQRALARNLAARADPDALATSAMIFDALNDRTAALEQARRAGRLAPERADLAWLELQLCVQTRACAPDRPARRLAALDPQNGVAFLHELPPPAAGRRAEEMAALLKMSQADRFDTYWAKLIVAAHDALELGRRSIQEEESGGRYSSAIDATGMIAAIGLPSFSGLTLACRDEALEDSTRRDICLRIARALQRADTVLAQAVGLAIEKRLWPADSREAAAVEARRQELQKWQRSLSELPSDADWEKRRIAVFRSHHGEREAGDILLAQYRASGHTAPAKRSTFGAAARNPFTSDAAFNRDTVPNLAEGSGRMTMPIELLNVNFLAVLVAALSSFLLGGLWYSRALFGVVWSREAGVSPDKQGHRPMVFVTSYLLAFIAAWLFAALLPADISVAQTTLLGALIGIAWVATSFGINYGFGDRSLTLWLIDAGYHTLQFTLYGAIIGMWR